MPTEACLMSWVSSRAAVDGVLCALHVAPDGAPCGFHVAPDGAPCGLRAAHDGAARRAGEWLACRAAKVGGWAAGPQPVIPAARWAKSPSSTRPVQKGTRPSDVRSFPFHFFPTYPTLLSSIVVLRL